MPQLILEQIEKASVDELRALQLEWLKWSLTHVYTNSPHYKKNFDAALVHPSQLKSLEDWAKSPVIQKIYTTPIPLACVRCRSAKWCAFTPAAHGRGSVYIAYGYGLFNGGLGTHYGAKKLGLTVTLRIGGQTDKQVQRIAECKF